MTDVTAEAEAIARNYVFETILIEMLARSPDLEIIERAMSARQYFFLQNEIQFPESAASVRAFSERTASITEQVFRDARKAQEHEKFRAAREG